MNQKTKAYISLIIVCIVWGTTYLAIRIGVAHYPPFLFAGVRQTIAGIVLMVGAITVRRGADLSFQNLRRQLLIGMLMLTLGNGLVSWGERYVPSGITALICSLMPLFAVLFNLLSSRREHFNATIGTGMLVGILGVALIFRNDMADIGKPGFISGMLAILIATAAWALGSMLNRKKTTTINPFFNSGLQLLFGGIIMLIISPAADDYTNLVLWNQKGFIALVYLTVFGSVLAYAAYMYELSVLPVGIATIYAYINPMIAVIVGAIFLHETVNMYTALAFLFIIISVYLVNTGYKLAHKQSFKHTSTPKTKAILAE